jgi:hypothetical protein
MARPLRFPVEQRLLERVFGSSARHNPASGRDARDFSVFQCAERRISTLVHRTAEPTPGGLQRPLRAIRFRRSVIGRSGPSARPARAAGISLQKTLTANRRPSTTGRTIRRHAGFCGLRISAVPRPFYLLPQTRAVRDSRPPSARVSSAPLPCQATIRAQCDAVRSRLEFDQRISAATVRSFSSRRRSRFGSGHASHIAVMSA